MKFPTVKLILLLTCVTACDNFLQVDPPISGIENRLVFSDDISATGAINGIYLTLASTLSPGFANGGTGSITSLAGLSADELHNYPFVDRQFTTFEDNELDAANTNIYVLWTSLYKVIYMCNAVLDGIDQSTGITSPVKSQLRGEALFVRAFCNFYLVNCFGDVPLPLSIDYRVNTQLGRTPADVVYLQVETDLLEAEDLLPPVYNTTQDRVRPCRFAATALLARMYLYRKDWQRAEDKATNVIAKSDLYKLPDVSSVFLGTSREAIWQLDGTAESYTFDGIGLQNNVLTSTLVNSFEEGDRRKVSWTKPLVSNGQTTTLMYKFKEQTPGIEKSPALRLAELYLIRAEARAQQDKGAQAIGDIDMVRNRAGLTLIKENNSSVTKEQLLLAIEQERRVELFVEWGHRWFDLKRWDRATLELASLKPKWMVTDVLYPLPAKEMRNNINLKPQNEGY